MLRLLAPVLLVTFAFAEQSPSAAPTQVIVMGTLHGTHETNPAYSFEHPKRILKALQPSAILAEALPDWTTPDGRFTEELLKIANTDECAVINDVAVALNVPIVPIEWPERTKHHLKINFYDRIKLFDATLDTLRRQSRGSSDTYALLLDVISNTGSAVDSMSETSSPRVINSPMHDNLEEAKLTVIHSLLPRFLPRTAEHKETLDFLEVMASTWNKRNRVMADLIVQAARKHAGKRVVVVTGATHRYVLLEHLSQYPGLDLKEYWEILDKSAIPD